MIAWWWLLVAVAAAYAVGRARPWERLGNWAEWQVRMGGSWAIGRRPAQAVLLATWAATSPERAWHAWRHRREIEERQAVRFSGAMKAKDAGEQR